MKQVQSHHDVTGGENEEKRGDAEMYVDEVDWGYSVAGEKVQLKLWKF